ncbi:MAG: phosphate acetyltransferase [Trueperaceae bacterium]
MSSPHVFLLAPTGPGAGLTTVSLGTVRALDRSGLRVAFFKPVRQPGRDAGREPSSHFVAETSDLEPIESFAWEHAASRLSERTEGRLLEEIVGRAERRLAAEEIDVLLVEGLVPTADHPELDTLNARIASAFDAEVILVGSLGDVGPEAASERFERSAQPFGGLEEGRMIGAIVNKVGLPRPAVEGAAMAPAAAPPRAWDPPELVARMPVFGPRFRPLGTVPWDPSWVSPRTLDVARHLDATVVHQGELAERRVQDVSVVARTVANMTHRLQPGALLITPGDRDDVILAVAMAASNGVPLAGLVLTGGIEPDARIMKLCERAFAGGLPLLTVQSDSYVSAARAASLDLEVPADDLDRIERIMNGVAGHLDVAALAARCVSDREPRLSPPAFLYRLVTRAAAADARIVLPEGDEPRTVRAAVTCHQRGIARCLLLADPDEVRRVAEAQGLTLPNDLEITKPSTRLRERYVAPMVALRAHKGMTEPVARKQLEDAVVLGTMMLAQGEVDGLVSGAVHTTASTVRPALQLIKTRRDAKLISSVFFMCLPDQVLVYGDCAINTDPNAEELADIAIQSAESARAFGIEPRVAMLSYSTGESGSGSDVDKVREATRIARERRPDLMIDGPLQYDAASVASVARSKAPDSKVAGRATVLIFPDLNTGNTTYKAVQRSAHVVSIGPMLQGLRRPVNDLSRGALVEDVVYTIALTAIQAGQERSRAQDAVASG